MNEIIFLVEEAVEGGYIAKALDEGIYTEAESMDELKANIKEAVLCHFEDESKRPKIARIHYVREETISVAG